MKNEITRPDFAIDLAQQLKDDCNELRCELEDNGTMRRELFEQTLLATIRSMLDAELKS